MRASLTTGTTNILSTAKALGPARKDDIDALVRKYKQDNADESSDEETERPVKPIVEWFAFNLGVGFIIALNALTIGLETDARGTDGDDVSGIWYIFELLFCVVFVGEIGLRLYYHRLNYFINRDKLWNIFDLFIVVLSVVDTFIITPIGLGDSIRFVSMLRFMRLMRLVRLIRLMRLFKELWLVANGLIQSAKTLCWVCVMVVVIIYICAIFTTLTIGKNDDLFDDYFRESGGWDHEVYFKTVSRSMFTLFQVMTFDSWSEGIARHIMQKQPWMVIFFVLFIAVTSFGLLNIIIGIIVENTLATSERDENRMKKEKERDRQRVFNHLRDIFEAADEDGSGTLTLAEVQKAIDKPEIFNKLKMIEFPVEDPKQIFLLLDYDKSGELSIDEFISGCIRIKGTAKSKDLLVAQVAVDTMRKHYQAYEEEMQVLQKKILLLDATARAMVSQGEHVFLSLREYRVRHPELDVRGSSPPRINTGDLNNAPWESEEAAAHWLATVAEEAQMPIKLSHAATKRSLASMDSMFGDGGQHSTSQPKAIADGRANAGREASATSGPPSGEQGVKRKAITNSPPSEQAANAGHGPEGPLAIADRSAPGR